MTLNKHAFETASDQLFALDQGAINLQSHIHDKILSIIENHLKALDYTKLVDFFRFQKGEFAAGEFWGKTVRSACLAYQYTSDAQLLEILTQSVADLLTTQTEEGCISAFPIDRQPYHSDLWERKYVFLGLLGYYEITQDPAILKAMIKLADYTISQVGPEPKVRIVDTGWAFDGIESSSILEPVMRVYMLTGYQRYLDFAAYIVEEEGACKRENIFEAAFNGRDPKDIGGNGDPAQSIAKAYEMMSCFEGLIEYYRVTGKEHWKEAALKFYNKLLEQEITLLGSGGADKPYNLGPGTGEQWNYTAFEQTNPDIGLMQETCVTVTWMKLCYQLLRLTGDSRIVDEIEKSIHNALIAALKPEGNYFDYFPKFNGTRNSQVNFSYTIGDFPLSCCTANGPMGMALIPFVNVMNSTSGPVVNLYISGDSSVQLPSGRTAQVIIHTDYPKTGSVKIMLALAQNEAFTLKLRIPEWSKQSKLCLNGNEIAAIPGTYAEINHTWSDVDRIELELDMRCRLMDAPIGSNRLGDDFQALVYGPIVLTRDIRFGENINEVVSIISDSEKYVSLTPVVPTVQAHMQFAVPAGQSFFQVIDYASAGTTWDGHSEYRTWCPCPSQH
ncbi:beta-L-arabinofuranosidase domain-containing protein [Cohnella silvisoli]|uniref:Glycoside hydrolase family 127 protein n=1 Tax=Cohnella silvisoli TaxID=2873699 RepID=A0ABV1KUD1_9BACL|nr:beta-L-arabinofuranosidase domain-containing protein [Cohnella silvisoli]MCD9021485.1 glycoside hydrolase family 127 protein [Cohnella silvisoli]